MSSGSSSYQNLFSYGERQSPRVSADIRDLEERLAKLEIVCEGLWNLLRDKTGLSEEDLILQVSEIDLQDGKYDGKKKKVSARECSKCKRKNHRNHTRCMYCGNLILSSPF